MKKLWRILLCTVMLNALLFLQTPGWAFDSRKVEDGLYYNGTNVVDQFWSPLFLASNGQLLDPFLSAQKNGLTSLQGRGKTTLLRAQTAFLFGACATRTKLVQTPPLVLEVPNIYVATFNGENCRHHQTSLFENFRLPQHQRNSNAFPTFYVGSYGQQQMEAWAYGVPGYLVGKNIPITPYTEKDLGGRPSPINGVIRRLEFLPLPVIEPDLIDIALAEKRPIPEYSISVLEAAHRSGDIVVSPDLMRLAEPLIKDRLWDLYYPRLFHNIKEKFGGIKRPYFELGLIMGVDLTAQNSFNYVGVARIGATTNAGQSRWIDVIYCWNKIDNSVSVISSSEKAFYERQNLFLTEINPPDESPHFIISGLSDFDKDKKMEVIASLVIPIANVVAVRGAPGSNVLYSRQSFLYAWQSKEANLLEWKEVYRTVEHEQRTLVEDASMITIKKFGH